MNTQHTFTLEEIDEAFAELERILRREGADPNCVTCSIDSVAIDVLKILRGELSADCADELQERTRQ